MKPPRRPPDPVDARRTVAEIEAERRWIAAGRPVKTPTAIIEEAMMQAYERGGALAAVTYAKELAPYTTPKLQAVAQVSTSDMRRLSNGELVEALSRVTALPPVGTPRPGKEGEGVDGSHLMPNNKPNP